MTKYKFISLIWILAVFTLAATGACGGETARPLANTPAAITPAATAPPTTTPPQTTPESTGPEQLLALLPEGSTEFAFVDVETVWDRPEFQTEVNRRFGRLMTVTGGVVTSDMVRMAGVKNGVFGFNQENGRVDHEVGILTGDFQMLLPVLDQAIAAGTAGSIKIEVFETYRGIKVYGFPSSPTVYLSVANRETLALSFSIERTKEIIDRVQDGGETPGSLLDALRDLGQFDFLYVANVEPNTENIRDNPFAAVSQNSFAVSFGEGTTSVLRSRFSFDEPEQATTAIKWMETQGHVGGLFFSSSVGQSRQEGRAILSEATVPDEDVISLMFGDD